MEKPQSPEKQSGDERNRPEKEGKPTEKAFYWVIALAALFFLYLFYSVATHDTVNIHGH